MGYELINRITVKKDGVYISSHSNNDTAPFHSHRIETLSKVYAEEGQKGLDREIFSMIYGYAELRGTHKSIERYQRVLNSPEANLFSKKYVTETDKKYIELSGEHGMTDEAKKEYEKFDKELKYNLCTVLAELIEVFDERQKLCEGCAHIGLRYPSASMYPCNSCVRAHQNDYYEPMNKNEKREHPKFKEYETKGEYLRLETETPMTSAMFAMLVSKYVRTIGRCSLCLYSNGECGDFAKLGKCRAMDKRINENILNFHTGTIEFATTRAKVYELIKVHKQAGLDKDQWIPEDVDEVIDSYITSWDCTSETNPFADFEKENGFAKSLYENLKKDVTDGIVYELDWSETKKEGDVNNE